MKPTIGRIVIVVNVPGNGADEQPAIINRVWGKGDTSEGPQLVNVCVLPDCGTPVCKASVPLYDSRDAAERYLQMMVGHHPVVAYWPEREPNVRSVAMPLAA
jgi:hypothetical protein